MAVRDQTIAETWAVYNGDCVEVMRELPAGKVGMALFSPPFADLYCYSDNPQDLGNCGSYDAFFEHFAFVIEGLRRVLMPGRLCVVHCIDIPAMKERDGYIGLKDFPGDIIRAFQSAGFVYHSRHVVWKDPLIEATRTKALGLMHQQLCKDSSRCRAGLPDYVLAFRAPGENETPVTHVEGLARYCGSDDPGGDGVKRSHNIWRRYASPVWMDVRQTHTLNYRAARDAKDEKHICPLQLDVIERACVLWSNPGEVVLSPFAGVGSEVYGAVLNGRKGVGIELKPSYYRQACRNLAAAEQERLANDTPLLALSTATEEEE
ncbi:MAG: site-specific DNA-methyltransferase [Lentisphaerae bacterium]|nr:site-specific DNA-methyltransferase [Lentisphaerota bacterium]